MQDSYWARYSLNGELRSFYQVIGGQVYGFNWSKKCMEPCQDPGLGWEEHFDRLTDSKGKEIFDELQRTGDEDA